MTDKEYELGDEDRVKIIGVFRRNDGDHKLVGVPEDRNISDFSGKKSMWYECRYLGSKILDREPI